jgi:hypothetical protein
MYAMAETIEGDLVWGVKNIAAEINQTPRQTHYQLEKGLLPGGQQGEKWVASRAALRAHFAKITSGAKKSA